MERSFEERQLSTPIQVTDLLNGQSVATLQQPYLLTEADFERLKSSPSITATLATVVFSGVVGYVIGLGPKMAPLFESKPIELTSGEVRTIIAGTAISIFLYVIGYLWPNDKKKMMKKITKHFDGSPPSAHIVGGKK